MPGEFNNSKILIAVAKKLVIEYTIDRKAGDIPLMRLTS